MVFAVAPIAYLRIQTCWQAWAGKAWSQNLRNLASQTQNKTGFHKQPILVRDGRRTRQEAVGAT